MKSYIDLAKKVLNEGVAYGDRTKTGRISLFGETLRFNLKDGFPLVTTKKTAIRLIIVELLWFLTGSTNAQTLVDQNVHIWDGWMVNQDMLDNPSAAVQRGIGLKSHIFGDISAEERSNYLKAYFKKAGIEPGSIGPMYGHVMRNAPGGNLVTHEALSEEFLTVAKNELASDKLAALKTRAASYTGEGAEEALVAHSYETIDQMQNLIMGLKRNPHSSRHLVSHWIPEYLPDERLSPQENVLIGRQALAPCHVLQQYYCTRLTYAERYETAVERNILSKQLNPGEEVQDFGSEEQFDKWGIPAYKLSLMLTQRS